MSLHGTSAVEAANREMMKALYEKLEIDRDRWSAYNQLSFHSTRRVSRLRFDIFNNLLSGCAAAMDPDRKWERPLDPGDLERLMREKGEEFRDARDVREVPRALLEEFLSTLRWRMGSTLLDAKDKWHACTWLEADLVMGYQAFDDALSPK
jgi:hypothetical protein